MEKTGFQCPAPKSRGTTPRNSSSGGTSILFWPLWELHSNSETPLPTCPCIIKNKSSNVSLKSSKLGMEICLFHGVYVVKDTEISINGFFLKGKDSWPMGEWSRSNKAKDGNVWLKERPATWKTTDGWKTKLKGSWELVQRKPQIIRCGGHLWT